jgi:hypothetical protein
MAVWGVRGAMPHSRAMRRMTGHAAALLPGLDVMSIIGKFSGAERN